MCGRYVQIPKKFSYIMKIVECNIPMTILYVQALEKIVLFI